MDQPLEWLTRAQVAAALQVHVGTVSRWISTDPQMRVRRMGPTGQRVRIHRSEIERRLIAPNEQSTTAAA